MCFSSKVLGLALKDYPFLSRYLLVSKMVNLANLLVVVVIFVKSNNQVKSVKYMYICVKFHLSPLDTSTVFIHLTKQVLSL